MPGGVTSTGLLFSSLDMIKYLHLVDSLCSKEKKYNGTIYQPQYGIICQKYSTETYGGRVSTSAGKIMAVNR